MRTSGGSASSARRDWMAPRICVATRACDRIGSSAGTFVETPSNMPVSM